MYDLTKEFDMPTVDPAGNASAALYTSPVRVQVPPQSVQSDIERPVVETSQTESSTPAATNEAANTRIGSIIDTTA